MFLGMQGFYFAYILGKITQILTEFAQICSQKIARCCGNHYTYDIAAN